jgi:hypothetical protein
LMKGAHMDVSRAAYRKFGVSHDRFWSGDVGNSRIFPGKLSIARAS